MQNEKYEYYTVIGLTLVCGLIAKVSLHITVYSKLAENVTYV